MAAGRGNLSCMRHTHALPLKEASAPLASLQMNRNRAIAGKPPRMPPNAPGAALAGKKLSSNFYPASLPKHGGGGGGHRRPRMGESPPSVSLGELCVTGPACSLLVGFWWVVDCGVCLALCLPGTCGCTRSFFLSLLMVVRDVLSESC